MKGVLNPNHIPINKWRLLIAGMPEFQFTEISEIESELETTQLPDRTHASGGNKLPTEFTARHPMHHTIENVALELWFAQSTGDVDPGYKKDATLVHISINGITLRTYQIIGIFPSKRTLPNKEMANEGELATNEWTFKADDVLY